MTQTPDGSAPQHFPDEGQVGFDAESAPDELHPEGPGAPVGETPPAPGVPEDGDDARSEDDLLDEMKGTISELTGDLQRLQAEYLNYKRRVDRDRDLVVQNARLSVLNGLLPVLDDIERAREHEELSGGFKAVAEALERVVSGAGLQRFGAPGDEFDPRLHEALFQVGESADVSTTTVGAVVRTGYRVGDEVLRDAQVGVIQPAEAAPEPEPDSDEE